MGGEQSKALAEALEREDSLKIELALALTREWALYQAPKIMDRIAAVEKENADLRAQLAGVQAALSKLVNDMRPEEDR